MVKFEDCLWIVIVFLICANKKIVRIIRYYAESSTVKGINK